MERRTFITGALAALAAAGANTLVGEEPPMNKKNVEELHPKDVNAHLRSLLATDLPHVVDHQIILTENARRAIIIVLQCHWSGDLTDEEMQDVEESQKENYELIKTLLAGGWIDSVHDEAMMAKGEPKPDPQWDFDPEKVLPDVQASNLARFGAVRVLAEAGKLVRKGAERTAAFNASGPALSMENGEEKDKLLFKDREDGFLSVLDAEEDCIACGVWGADHDFVDNLDAFNLDALNNNQKEKLTSMVCLTTTAIRKRMLRMRKKYTEDVTETLPAPRLPHPTESRTVQPPKQKKRPRPSFGGILLP